MRPLTLLPLVAMLLAWPAAAAADDAHVATPVANATVEAEAGYGEGDKGKGLVGHARVNVTSGGDRLELFLGRPGGTICGGPCGLVSAAGQDWSAGVRARTDEPAAAAPAPRGGAEAAGAALAAAGAASLLLLGVVPRLLLVAYSRLSRHEVLAHPRRAALWETLRQHPGAHTRELARLSGLPRTVLMHHLAILRAHGLAHALRHGRRVHHFPRGAASEAAALVAAPGRARLVDALLAAPDGAPRAALAQATALPPGSLRHHLRVLVRAGLVEPHGQGRRTYRATEALRALPRPR